MQGVGYPSPNLSHFRSIEIWDTASDSQQFLQTGWLTRAATEQSGFNSFSADGVMSALRPGSAVGRRARGRAAMTRRDSCGSRGLPARIGIRARLAGARAARRERHRAGRRGPQADVPFKTEFPRGAFGTAVQHAARTSRRPARCPIVRLTLSGFDTHQNQLPRHAQLLRDRRRIGRRAENGAERARAVGSSPGADLFGIRPPAARERQRGHRSRHDRTCCSLSGRGRGRAR